MNGNATCTANGLRVQVIGTDEENGMLHIRHSDGTTGWGAAERFQRDAQITLTNAHGTFSTTPAELDLTIARYANMTRNGLWTAMEETNAAADYGDVQSVSEFLIMLSDAGQY